MYIGKAKKNPLYRSRWSFSKREREKKWGYCRSPFQQTNEGNGKKRTYFQLLMRLGRGEGKGKEKEGKKEEKAAKTSSTFAREKEKTKAISFYICLFLRRI